MGPASIMMLTISIFTAGCKKFVEIENPHNSITSQSVYESNTAAASAVAGMYATFQVPGLYAGLSSDELTNFAGITNVDDYQLATNSILVDNAVVESGIWTPLYKSVFLTNSILDGVSASKSPLLTDSARRQLIGEARFIRAFNFFTLTNYFGDIPLPLVSDFHQTAVLPRAPQTMVYDQIVADLTQAKELLPADYNVAKGERIRANKWAAVALLARAYLYQKNWTAAEAQATAILTNSNQFQLVSPLSAVFEKNSKEAIFQLMPSAQFSPYGILEQSYFTPSFPWSSATDADQKVFFANWALYSGFFIPAYHFTPEQAAAFEANDLRKTAWTAFTPSPAEMPYNNVVTYFPSKYTQLMTPGATVFSQYEMILRVAEQYLIRAEARAQQNNLSGAAADINAIRLRAGLSETVAKTQTELLKAVAQERRAELFAEGGHRWFDLKRTAQAVTVLGAIPTKQGITASQLLYPIPPREINNDPNLVQNQGY